MSETFTFGEFLQDVRDFGLRVTEIEPFPTQYVQATEDIIVRTVVSRYRNDTIGTMNGTDVVQSLTRRLGYGETCTIELRNPYGEKGKLTIKRATSHYVSVDGFAWQIDADLRSIIDR